MAGWSGLGRTTWLCTALYGPQFIHPFRRLFVCSLGCLTLSFGILLGKEACSCSCGHGVRQIWCWCCSCCLWFDNEINFVFCACFIWRLCCRTRPSQLGFWLWYGDGSLPPVWQLDTACLELSHVTWEIVICFESASLEHHNTRQNSSTIHTYIHMDDKTKIIIIINFICVRKYAFWKIIGILPRCLCASTSCVG